jgi:hypothetical protein
MRFCLERHPAALSRTHGQIRPAAARECRRHRGSDEGVAAALGDGVITPGEGEAIVRILDTFVPGDRSQ